MDKIYEVMLKLGVPTNLRGFDIMHDLLEILINSKSKLKMQQLYKILAEQTNSKKLQIERNICVAVKKTCQVGNLRLIEDIFGKSEVTPSEWLSKLAFVLQQNPADSQKPYIINVEGYKAFHGTMKILPIGEKPYTITADWLYKPDNHCWFGCGRSFHESYCEIV